MRHTLHRRALLGAGLLPALPGRPARAQPDGSLARVLDRGRLRIGITINGTALAFHDDAGRLDGLAAVLGRHLARGLGVEPEFIPAEWPNRVPDLLARRFDILLTPPAATIELAREVMLTEPFAQVFLVALAPPRLQAESLREITHYRIAALGGPGLPMLTRRLLAAPLRLNLLNTWEEIANSIANGESDVAIVPDPLAAPIRRRLPSFQERFRIAELLLSAALRYGEHDLLRAVNTQLFILRQERLLTAMHELFLGRPLPPPVHL